MSQISSISSHYEESDSCQSDHTPSSSHSQCNSSTSILTAAAQLAQNREASASTLETAWTDSKHSSYLNFMEASFVQNMFGSSYCSEDVRGKMYEHQQYTDTDECDDDSAQSRLCIPYENMEFKMFDHGDWTWKSCWRPVLPASVPLVLLSNPWVKHFRTKNATNTAPMTLLSSKKDNVRSMVTLSPTKQTGSTEHVQRLSTHNIVSGSNPGMENGDLQAGQMKRRIQKAILDQTIDPHVSSTKRRALWATYNQVRATRRRIYDVKSCGQIGRNNQDGVSPPGVEEGLESL